MVKIRVAASRNGFPAGNITFNCQMQNARKSTQGNMPTYPGDEREFANLEREEGMPRSAPGLSKPACWLLVQQLVRSTAHCASLSFNSTLSVQQFAVRSISKTCLSKSLRFFVRVVLKLVRLLPTMIRRVGSRRSA